MEDLISVIIPVYNARSFLRRSVASVCRQSYRNLEIILVDDGSTDGSSTICDCLSKKDKRIITIHQKNGGASKARNTGLEYTGGGYIFFLDADDWLPKSAVENLLNFIKKERVDFVCGNYSNVYRIPKASITSSWHNSVIDIQDYTSLSDFLPISFITPWGKLYRKEIIEKFSLRFDESMTTGEDTNFVLRYLLHCNRIASIKKNVYFWNKLNDNITLSGRYHDKINQYHFRNMELRLSFFEKGKLPLKEQAGVLQYFIETLICYVTHLDKGEVLSNKIKETYDLFRGILDEIQVSEIPNRYDGVVNAFTRCKESIRLCNYNDIYDFLITYIARKDGKQGIIRLEQAYLKPIYRYLVFHLNLFFHN